MIKVGPDGRIYGHFNGTAALDPTTGSVVWQSAGNPDDAFMPLEVAPRELPLTDENLVLASPTH